MHLGCYRQRDDVNAVVQRASADGDRAHMVGFDFQQCIIPEMVVLLGLMPTAAYSTPPSQENSDAVTDLIREHDAIMLSNHGSLTVANRSGTPT